MKNFTFLKKAKKENALASEAKSCRPEKINMRVTTSQYEMYYNSFHEQTSDK